MMLGPQRLRRLFAHLRLVACAEPAPGVRGESADLYTTLAKQHEHPQGPWKAIVATVREVLPAGTGSLLDLATGPGEPATTICKEFPELKVTATDVSQDMLTKAQATGAGLKNMAFVIADMQDLSGFLDGSFDLVTCCYGYMFPADRVLALRETSRVMKPGGTLIATYWLNLPMLDLGQEVLTAVLGSTPPPRDRGPMSLSQPGLMEGFLKETGFTSASFSDSEYPWDMGKDEDIMFRMGCLPITAALEEATAGKPEGMAIARSAFFAAVDKRGFRQSDGRMVITGNRFRMVVAKKKLND